MVLNFWFTTCGPCLAEIPELNQLVKAYENKDIIFIAFSLDSEATLKKFLSKTPFNYKIVPLYNKVISDYQAFRYPTHVIIDKNGVVQYAKAGATEGEMYNRLKTEIEKLQ